jgi:hypothetical protein
VRIGIVNFTADGPQYSQPQAACRITAVTSSGNTALSAPSCLAMPADENWRHEGGELRRQSMQWQQQHLNPPPAHQQRWQAGWKSLASGWLLLNSALTDLCHSTWQADARKPPVGEDAEKSLIAYRPLSQSLAPMADGKHASSFLGLPMAAAEMTPHRPDVIEHNADLNVLIAAGYAGKTLMLNLAMQYLRKIDGVDENFIRKWESAWRIAAADAAIVLMPDTTATSPPAAALQERAKRISQQQADLNVAEHIRKNCAFEATISHSTAAAEGKLLIFYAQRLENPFSLLYPDLPDAPSDDIQRTANSLNFAVDVLSIGLKPLFGSLIANYLRKKYFDDIGDKICSHRQTRLSLAQLATGLEIDSRPYIEARPKHLGRKPLELDNANYYQGQSAYFLNNQHDNIRSELILTATPTNLPASQRKSVQLKPVGQDEFEIISTRGSGSSLPSQRLHYDRNTRSWRYKNRHDSPNFLLQISEGENLVIVSDMLYPMRKSNQQQYEILGRKANREQWLAVYQEPLSKTWHLTTENHYPVATDAQLRMLENSKINAPDAFQYRQTDNQNPKVYGNGKLFEVRNKHDDAATTTPLFLVAELHGMIVPVRPSIHRKSGIHYEIYTPDNLPQRGHSIRWDGERWHISAITSRHVSHDLHARITPQMLVDVDERSLSSTDWHGIRWDVEGQGYLKVRDRFVKIHEGKTSYIGSPLGRRIFIHYRDRQFHPLIAIPKPAQESQFRIGVKSEAVRNLQEHASTTSILDAVSDLFPSQQIHLEQVPASDLNSKRFIISNNDEQLVLETSTSGAHSHILTDEEQGVALSKHHRRFFGGNVRHIQAIVRNGQSQPAINDLRAEVDAYVRQHIARGAERIQSTLERLQQQTIYGKKLILCQTDFLETDGRSKNFLASPQAIYETLAAHFIPLSQRFPDTIIVPGSLHMAQEIDTQLHHHGIRQRQGGTLRYLDESKYFWATVAPVFHNGKLITIARKGEPLIYQEVAAHGKTEPMPIVLGNLDTTISDGGILLVANLNPKVASSDEVNVFAGKTLLPGERKQIANIFFPAEEYLPYDSLNNFFSNTFMLDGEKFLLVIEDEFKQHEQPTPTVRSKVFVNNGEEVDIVSYDWILHPAAGEPLDDLMASAADNYLYADGIIANHLSSKLRQHLSIVDYVPEQQLAIYDYHDISGNSQPLPQARREQSRTALDEPD